MGRDIAAGLLGAAPLAKSSDQEIYVNNVGRWLALHSSRPDLPWHFGILDVDTVNAFATPGGNVFISRGLIARIHGESELAGILAHEISHVALKHHLADIQKNAQKNLALDLASVKSGGLAGEAARAVARVGLEGYVRGLSREDELAADRMGVVIAARAGYEPYGLVAVLQTLAAEPQSDAALGFFLKTHPGAERPHRGARGADAGFVRGLFGGESGAGAVYQGVSGASVDARKRRPPVIRAPARRPVVPRKRMACSPQLPSFPRRRESSRGGQAKSPWPDGMRGHRSSLKHASRTRFGPISPHPVRVAPQDAFPRRPEAFVAPEASVRPGARH